VRLADLQGIRQRRRSTVIDQNDGPRAETRNAMLIVFVANAEGFFLTIA